MSVQLGESVKRALRLGVGLRAPAPRCELPGQPLDDPALSLALSLAPHDHLLEAPAHFVRLLVVSKALEDRIERVLVLLVVAILGVILSSASRGKPGL